MKRKIAHLVTATVCLLSFASSSHAVTNVFFNAAQTAAVVTTNMTSTTIRSGAYQFTYSVDGWWYPTISIGGGTPTGRFFSVVWPSGVQAQTITAGPSGLLTQQSSATITIKRVDGQSFDLKSFTGKILGNTAGAGAAFEIMPQLNGQDAFPDPLMYDATGYGGQSFSYAPNLTGYDTYQISLWMDFALTALTLVDASDPPVLQISLTSSNYINLSWSTNCAGYFLQQNFGLDAISWVDVTNSVRAVGTNNLASIPVTNGISFYRLITP